MPFPFELPKAHLDAIAKGERQEEFERQARLAEQAYRAEMVTRMGEIAEHVSVYRTGHTQAELREAASNAAVARELRDHQAEWGSAQRTAKFISAADGRLIPLRPAEQAGGPFTVRADSVQASLVRAREVTADPFMQRMCQEFDSRQEARRSAERAAEYARAEEAYRRGESGDEDPPAQRSGRVPSGTGWPEIVR